MKSVAELEAFFGEHLPKTKEEIETLWQDRRGELNEFLLEWSYMAHGTWMKEYFDDMLFLSKTGSHKYTNPWEVI